MKEVLEILLRILPSKFHGLHIKLQQNYCSGENRGAPDVFIILSCAIDWYSRHQIHWSPLRMLHIPKNSEHDLTEILTFSTISLRLRRIFLSKQYIKCIDIHPQLTLVQTAHK